MLHWVSKPSSRQTGSGNSSLAILLSGQVVSALVGLVYGKLTAIYISPAVWGDYTLWFVIMALLHGLFVSPTLQSFKAALVQFPQQQVITFYGRALLMIYFTIILLLSLGAGLYYKNPIFGLIWIASVGQGMYLFINSYLNAFGHHRSYALMQTGYSISTVLGFVFMVIEANNPMASGLWQAAALTNTVWAVVAGWRLIRDNGAVITFTIVTDLVELCHAYRQYLWPLLSLAFWGWLINYADRYLIRLYLTDADVGQYSMGYSLGSKLVLLVAPLLAFLSPQILRLRASGQPPQTANRLIGHYLIRYGVLAGLGCFLFYAGREWMGHLLLSDQYAPAFLIAPIVAAGYLLLTSTHLLELKWYAFGQTHYVLWHNVLGAVLNVGFNLLLIPSMDIMGAALATLLGFAGQFLLAFRLFLAD